MNKNIENLTEKEIINMPFIDLNNVGNLKGVEIVSYEDVRIMKKKVSKLRFPGYKHYKNF